MPMAEQSYMYSVLNLKMVKKIIKIICQAYPYDFSKSYESVCIASPNFMTYEKY